jgi:putative glycosyltransferase (TIGR04372 family)
MDKGIYFKNSLIAFLNFLSRALDKEKMFMILLLPLYVLIRIISPIVLIRFSSLQSYRIGHFVGNIDMYMCERDQGIQPRNSIDIFFIDPKYGFYVCNEHLLAMWKKVIHVSQVAYYLWRIDKKISGGSIHNIKTAEQDKDIRHFRENSPVYLSFTSEEKLEAQTGLEKMGIGKKDKYICLANRDQCYLNKKFPDKNWSYHSFRNSNIQNYIETTGWLNDKGYFVIRLGEDVGEIMNAANSKYIEYSHRGLRTELLDIYMGANCAFFISSDTGIDAISAAFRRPIVYVNYSSLIYTPVLCSNSVIIFKKLWLKKERRFMSYRQILESGVGRLSRTQEFDEHGIEHIENTSEEILDATIEMHERLKGTWQATVEDEELQSRFRSAFPKSRLYGEIRARIGAKFLRDNHELLD